MHRELYRFGGVTFAVESAEGIERSKMCEPFRVEDAAADHTICLTFSDAIPEPPQGAAQSGPVYRWQESGARHLLQRYSVAGKTPQFTCAVTRGARTDVTFAESYRVGASVRAVLEAAGLFDIFADAGMLVLHSAYIVTRGGEGILFSGPSGVGKSTQAALWERFAGARTVNGDRALVRPVERTVGGVFYAGTSGICQNVTAPLRAVVLLGQAAENRVVRARPQETFARLLSQCAYYEWDAASAARMTELAAQLVTNVPVWRMDCRADESAVRALEEAMRRA